MEKYKCPLCGNTDPKMIGYLNGKPYCRRCITFKGEEADNVLACPKNANYSLSYELSNDQKRLSSKLIENYKKGINSLVHAVCGSGKTEIVLEVIKYAIQCGEKVGFAIPRRDVAIELYERFNGIFKKNKVILVYGGHTEKLEGDLVCLTTHQLFRYQRYFDLLIIDEVDAFPFKNNDVLNEFFYRSIKGKYIMMSATPDEKLLNKFQKDGMDVLELFSRFHEHPLPVPELYNRNSISCIVLLIRQLRKFIKMGKPVFIFCPTIDIAESTFSFLRFLVKSGACVHSKKNDRTEIIRDFKSGKYKYLVTTAVLERGVTVKDLQVIVYKAGHKIYDRYSLVQIAGRVGRKKDALDGQVIFISNKLTEDMQKAREDIINANRNL